METEGNGDVEDDGSFDRDSGYGPYASFDVADWKQLEEQFRSTQIILQERAGKAITRLKRPRDLYALSSQSSPQLNVRWPAEVQVLPLRPKHYYGQQGKCRELLQAQEEVPSPPRSSDIFGKVVYDNSPDPAVKYFVRSRAGGKPLAFKPYYTLQGPSDKTLLFESRFESGNLMRAIKVGEFDYELWLQFDLYTKKYTQWFYFQVQNTRPGIQYRFTIMNFMKDGSLYNRGMRPLLYSEYGTKTKGQGWVRAGSNIRYYRNDIRTEEGKERFYYSLTWTCSFPYDNDIYYFAHCYPYTYSDLQEYLTTLTQDEVKSKFCKQRVLCQTLAGNHIYALTITTPTRHLAEAQLKRVVVVTARVHPGETNASWMMKGFLDYITSDAQDAKVLRNHFIFKVIPMLNPDGVIVGNYRCSLAGRDLNRNYKTVLKESFPPVWHTRQMVKRLHEERSIALYCDFHGHSRKQNVFIYGCGARKHSTQVLGNRVFPYMLWKNAPDKFSFDGCRFKAQKNKEGTGRLVVWNLGIDNSYTMETTFCGSTQGKGKGYHFSTADFQAMGYHFCDTLLDYFDPDPLKVSFVIRQLELRIAQAFAEKMEATGVAAAEPSFEQALAFMADAESDSGGSDSSISDGLPMQLLYATVPELSRKKRLKTRKERNERRNSMTVKRPATQESSTKITESQDPSAEHECPEKAAISRSKSRFKYKTSRRKDRLMDSNSQTKLQDECLLSSAKGSTSKEETEDGPCRQESPLSKLTGVKSQRSACEICHALYGSSQCSEASDQEISESLRTSVRTQEKYLDLPSSYLSRESRPLLGHGLAKHRTSYHSLAKPRNPHVGRLTQQGSLTKYNQEGTTRRSGLHQGKNLEYICKELEKFSSGASRSFDQIATPAEKNSISKMYQAGGAKENRSYLKMSIAEARAAQGNPRRFASGTMATGRMDSPISVNDLLQNGNKARLPTLETLRLNEASDGCRKRAQSLSLSSNSVAYKFSGGEAKDRAGSFQRDILASGMERYYATSTQKRCPERRSFHQGASRNQSQENFQHVLPDSDAARQHREDVLHSPYTTSMRRQKALGLMAAANLCKRFDAGE